MKPHLFSSIPIGVTILTGIMFFSTCQEPEKAEPYPDSALLLEKLDVNCTEAWLKVSLTGTDSSAATDIPVILTRDGETLNSFSFTPPETLVVDAGLNPSHNYQYQAQRQSVHDNKVIASSNTLSLTTLDTTSHNFSWTIDTLGEYGSYLNDVAIINENNIWAVGMIRTDEYDSTSGTNYTDYNAAHWDGERWELVRIAPESFLFAPLTAVFARSGNDIWVAGTAPMSYDGESWSAETTFPTFGWIHAIWGSSPEDVWFVGSGGSIVHYDGTGFTRLESGTDVDLKDIWGNTRNSGPERIWAAGFSDLEGSALLQYDGIRWDPVYEIFPPPPTATIPGQLSWIITSVWTNNPNKVFCSSTGRIYEAPWNTDGFARENINYNYQPGDAVTTAPFTNRVRGNDGNDLFVVGQSLWAGHFNGNTWHTYNQLAGDGNYHSVSTKGNVTVVVGMLYENAIIQKGLLAIGNR